MRRRTYAVISVVGFAVVIVLYVCCGILTGLIQEWPRMGFAFFLVVHQAGCFVFYLLNCKIESHFLEMKTRITGKSASDQLAGKFVPNSLIISMIIFIVIFFALAFLAGNRGYWLILSILIVVFLITNFVFTAIIVWLKVKACTKRLEELISRNKEGEMRTEPGEV